jgi:hypothetical protein
MDITRLHYDKIVLGGAIWAESLPVDWYQLEYGRKSNWKSKHDCRGQRDNLIWKFNDN